ncbi:MAG TPA: tannase/feruloyl esterase family alpha/beta hydrolase [Blastocatellia bacterium]|nr:tannase/feruloyl esterase family alpha/beta hydrolase [Blastocatellia bacterium]
MTHEHVRQRQPGAAALLLLLFSAGVLGAAAVAAQTRDPLSDLKLPNTTIVSVETVAAGAFTPPAGTFNLPGPSPFKSLPAFRRVVGRIKPTSDSNINFEVWLPVAGWNEKFRGVGNGGFAGSVSYLEMAGPLGRGYAVASTDTGHSGTPEDATWATAHPEKVIDFGYRSIHEMTEKAKAVVTAFYGKAPKLSYFGSCSNGGRQALMEAQRYPSDYDGIIAGAPANDWTHLTTQGMFISQATLSDPASYIPASKIMAIEAAALAACDGVDGLKDDLIDDPTRCRFNPSVLLCTGPETDACLTAAQVEALKKIYAGPRDSKGNQIYPGLVAGGESGFGGWALWVSGPSPGKSFMNAIASQFFKSLVFEDQNWDVKSLNVERDVKLADEKFARILNATDPDLSAYKKRGGKLIMYHGWSDAAIAPENAIDYYKSVVSKMGQRETAAFLRLYMVPGLQHCFLGPGPNNFGQAFGCAQCDAQHDIYMALERWVEQGLAPDAIIATKYENDFVPTKAVRTRPLCPYPNVARYKGSGSTDDAANFACAPPKK